MGTFLMSRIATNLFPEENKSLLGHVSFWCRRLRFDDLKLFLIDVFLINRSVRRLRNLLQPYENVTANPSYVLINCWVWVLLFYYFTARNFSKLAFGEVRAGIKHTLGMEGSILYINFNCISCEHSAMELISTTGFLVKL